MRDIPVGNGSLLVNFDDKYQIRDIYLIFALAKICRSEPSARAEGSDLFA